MQNANVKCVLCRINHVKNPEPLFGYAVFRVWSQLDNSFVVTNWKTKGCSIVLPRQINCDPFPFTEKSANRVGEKSQLLRTASTVLLQEDFRFIYASAKCV